MNKPRIVITEDYHPASNDWTSFVVDTSNPGPHKTYHIVENSGCRNVCFHSKAAAHRPGKQKASGYIANFAP